MGKIAKCLAILLTFCLLLTSCAPAPQQPAGSSEAQIENLTKLCKVWGYVKYTHPVFLLGEKDWDEELLKLIPAVSEADSDEVNRILHEWVVSLGEVDYGGARKTSISSQRIVQADFSWLSDEDYLGSELMADLEPLGGVAMSQREKAPVFFSEGGIPDFSNEPVYEQIDYADQNYRLLGLFRVWNAIEYYFPYLDIIDGDWNELLVEYIPRMLEGTDQTSFELTICELSAHLKDAHVFLEDSDVQKKLFGKYSAPVYLTKAEGQIVVQRVFVPGCSLQVGDIILQVDGVPVEQRLEAKGRYISYPNENKLAAKVYPTLLRSHKKQMQVTILRDGEEQLLSVQGTEQNYQLWQDAFVASELLEGNIGLIHPSQLSQEQIAPMMEQLRDTEGLIIDLREYPSAWMLTNFAAYFKKSYTPFAQLALPSPKIPGTYDTQVIYSGYAPVYQQQGVYHYEKPVVLLMNEQTWSQSEYVVMGLRGGNRVKVLGSNSIGSDGNMRSLPLPDGNALSFTTLGVYTPEMGQTQRVGLAPDIEVYPTIEGIKEGRDELMEAAIAYIQERSQSATAAE